MSAKNNKNQWERNVYEAIQYKPICGWTLLTIKGRGVFLLPCDLERNPNNRSGNELDLVGKYKVVFEFFRLDRSGVIKLSARVAGIYDQPQFHEFWGIARACVTPKPGKPTKITTTQSVAKWNLGLGRTFDRNDTTGMVCAIESFLMSPTSDFNLFLACIRNYFQ